MDPQVQIILPFEVIVEILKFSGNKQICILRETCKKFQRHIDIFIQPRITTITTEVNTPYFGVLDSSSNSLYVSNYGNNTIKQIDLLTNQVITTYGSPASNNLRDKMGNKVTFKSPSGLALHTKENLLYISDSYNHTIRCMNLVDGKVNTIAGRDFVIGREGSSGNEDGIGNEAKFFCPCGLALDSISNHLYVADSYNHSIRKIGLEDRKVETLCGSGKGGYADGPFEEAMFSVPNDVALNLNTQELYVSDTQNHIVRVLSLKNKTVSTLCGIPKEKGYANGSFTQAKFKWPFGLRLDVHSNHLYVSDENHVIRRVSLLGEVKTNILCGIPRNRRIKGNITPTFSFPKGIVIDNNSHHLYIMDDHGIRKVVC